MAIVRRGTPPDARVGARGRGQGTRNVGDATQMAGRTTQASGTKSRGPATRPRTDHPEAYIPGDRRRALAAGVAITDRVQGTAVFADISGFTPLTEALVTELGAVRGPEELTAVLDTVFDAVLGELHRFGGTVLYFSGDAVTCWLDGDDGVLGVACGLAMQEAMDSVGAVTTPGGTTVELGMKVAVASGRARRFVAGDPDIQLIDVLAGSLMDRLAGAEHDAERGQVVVEETTARGLRGRVDLAGLPGGTGTVLARRLLVPLPPLAPARGYPRLPAAVVRQWLLPPVYERMKTGRGEFLSELRPAVPMFVRFGGIDFDQDPDAPAKLDDFVRSVQRAVDGHGGNVLQLTVGDKGAYLYAVFGSPIAHEDDAARACAAALDVLALEGRSAAADLQIGLASGRLRSGTYGHRQRRTFCCLGDAVNLAARLMSAAPPGQVYVTPAVAKAAASRFDFEELEAMKVKGKSQAIAVRRLLEAREQGAGRRLRALHPVVGREQELDRLASLADGAFAGRGYLAGICAEAGMGKSSLAAVLSELVEDRGVPLYVGAAESVGAATSYLAWQPIWRRLFGLSHDRSETPEEVAARLEGVLADVDPGLAPRLPLLGAVLGVAIEDNELTASFDAKLRKTSLESLLVQLLVARTALTPVAIVIEDCHWLDPLSVDLLALVAGAAAAMPLFLLVTYRPGSFSAPALEHTCVLELDRLDEASCREVLVARLADLYGAGRAPAGLLVDRLVARAEGNPFYLGELANYLHDRGADPADPAAAAIELPASLSSLVLSRIDTLGEAARRTLKVASVVGRDFDVGMLAGAYPTLGGSRQVLGQLRSLVAEDLVVAEDPAADRFAFRHAVIQEVAYESLPFALRATVHGRVGAWLEVADPEALDLLAHHYWHSEEEEKKREYLRRAGDAAKARYANQAAADYYRRLAPLLGGSERAAVLGKLGEVFEVQGQWPEAVETRLQSLVLAEQTSDPGALAWAHVRVAAPLQMQGRYDEAQKELDIAEQLFADLGDLAGLAWVASTRGVIALHTGAEDDAWVHLQHSLELRRKHGDRALLRSALTNLGVAAMSRGDYETAQRFTEESLALRIELGERSKLSLQHNNLGMIAYLQGDYERAISHLDEAIRLGSEIGSLWTVAIAHLNSGNCAREQGQRDVARDHYAPALHALALARDQRSLYILFQDVAMWLAPERPETAFRLYGAADAVRLAIGATRTRDEEDELEAHLAPARALLGDVAVRAEASGRELRLDDAIALCREVCRPST